MKQAAVMNMKMGSMHRDEQEHGPGMKGHQNRRGEAAPDQTVAESYSDDAVAELLFMIEEEKLAGDIYEEFYDLYGVKVFNNIAHSEDRHFDALVNQAEALDLDISHILSEDAGSYQNADLQAMYDNLLATGSESLEAALEVGVAIEQKDIVDIAAASASVEGTTLANVYDHLLEGSNHHLDAFESHLY